jgi:hypothetical protein
MRVEGHEAIVADNDDFMPVRPDDAYHRQNGAWGYGGDLTDSDRKQIYIYKSDMLRIYKSAAYVIWLIDNCGTRQIFFEDQLVVVMLEY